MRHLKAHRKLGRTSEHRHSMLRNLATSLINARDERIQTTLPKAKELRPFIEKAITLARQAQNLQEGSEARALHLRRQAAGYFHAGNTSASALTGKRGVVRAERTAGVAALKRLFEACDSEKKGVVAIIELVDNPRELEAQEAGKKRAAKTAGTKKKAGSKKSKGKAEEAEETAADE